MFQRRPKIDHREHSITLLTIIADSIRLLGDVVPKSFENIEKALERELTKRSNPYDEWLKDILSDIRAQNTIQIELLKRIANGGVKSGDDR